jgi:hypothetical protein
LSKQTSKQGKVNNRGTRMTRNNRVLSILTLNVNGLNAPIKRHRRANWVKKQDLTIVFYKRLISLKKINTGLESKDGKKFSKQMDPINRQE